MTEHDKPTTPDLRLLDYLVRYPGVGKEVRISGGGPRAQAATTLVRLGYACKTQRGIALTQAGVRRGLQIRETNKSQFHGWLPSKELTATARERKRLK